MATVSSRGQAGRYEIADVTVSVKADAKRHRQRGRNPVCHWSAKVNENWYYPATEEQQSLLASATKLKWNLQTLYRVMESSLTWYITTLLTGSLHHDKTHISLPCIAPVLQAVAKLLMRVVLTLVVTVVEKLSYVIVCCIGEWWRSANGNIFLTRL